MAKIGGNRKARFIQGLPRINSVVSCSSPYFPVFMFLIFVEHFAVNRQHRT